MLSGAVNSFLQNGFLGQDPNQDFTSSYKCFSIAHAPESLHSLEEGDKIVLPASALNALAQRQVQYPMLFELRNSENSAKRIFCGVMEFSAREGVCFVPHWLMQNIAVSDGDLIFLKNVTLPKGRFIQLQPHLTKFTTLSDPRAILERKLRSFSCMTKGSTIAIQYSDVVYQFNVTDVKPADAVSIIEADVEVDFAPPLDYDEHLANNGSSAGSKSKEPKPKSAPQSQDSAHTKADEGGSLWKVGTEEKQAPASATSSSYFARLGAGHSLNSKTNSSKNTAPVTESASASSSSVRASHSLGSTPGTSRVIEDKGRFRYIYEIDSKTQQKRLVRRVAIPKSSMFQGQGHSLSKKRANR